MTKHQTHQTHQPQNKTKKQKGGSFKKFIKNLKNKTKKYIVNHNKEYITDYDMDDIFISNTLYQCLIKNNINNEKLSKLIINNLKDNEIFADLVKNDIFIKKIKNLIIIKDFSVLDDIMNDPKYKRRISGKANGELRELIYSIMELEEKILLIVLLQHKNDKQTNNLLVKPIKQAYEEYKK
jgi:hypothetical protein